MKITTVTATRYSADSKGGYTAEIIVVTVDTDEGITGTGYTNAPAGAGVFLKGMIDTLLTPVITDADPMSTSALWDKMHAAVPRRGGDGIMRYCLSAIDIALWDIKAKAQNVPVWKLFGGSNVLVPTYANCAHHLPADDLAERAASYVAKGHKALKIRGTRSFVTPAEATVRVEKVRDAIGPDVRLMVDVNGSWDVDTAIQQLKAWEKYNLYWLEEPVPPYDIPGYAQVRARSGGTYIVGGEQHQGIAEFRTLIDQGGVDMIQPNTVVTGGVTDWLRVHAYATARNVPVSPWDMQAVHLHMGAGLPNVKWIEYFMPDNALQKFQTELFAGPVSEEVVTDEGVFLKAPSGSGFGIILDKAVADKARVKDQ